MNNSFFQTFAGKNILVTGGTGSIGSEIVEQLLKYHPQQIRIFSRDETKQYYLQQKINQLNSDVDVRFLIGDIRDKERLDRAMGKISIVFHAAALKHVPFCEYNPFEAVKTNVHGTQNLIDVALKNNIEKFVAISTDKAVYPNCIMGMTKLLAERMVISAQNYMGDSETKFAVVRFGNVLNSRGSVVPTWIEQIKNGNAITVTDKKMSRYVMTIPQAVNLVFSATEMMLGQEIVVLKMKEKNIYDLAKETIAKHANGKKISINITGLRDREKIREQLYTDEEKNFMLETEQFNIILSNEKTFKERQQAY